MSLFEESFPEAKKDRGSARITSKLFSEIGKCRFMPKTGTFAQKQVIFAQK
jgi:hypothetical protein